MALRSDETRLEALDLPNIASEKSRSGPDYLEFLEWREDLTESSRKQDYVWEDTISCVLARSNVPLRLIFAPLHFPDNLDDRTLSHLFPEPFVLSSFTTERKQSVTHAFGAFEDEDSCHYAWCHSLCKNINIENVNNILSIRDPRNQADNISQADWSWRRLDCLMKWSRCDNLSENESSTTLILFGASELLKARLQKTSTYIRWPKPATDPFALWTIILDELFLDLDRSTWNFIAVFGYVERAILDSAGVRAVKASFDFVGLHNMAKHVIHLTESANALSRLAEGVLNHHQSIVKEEQASPKIKAFKAVQRALEHKAELFKSSQLRLASLDKRVQNIINLSFNLVNQQGSKLMARDSRRMTIIQYVTVTLLPIATVATVFGSEFFSFQQGDDGENRVKVSTDFWVFWVVVGPTTLASCLLCYLLQRQKLLRKVKLDDDLKRV